MPITHSPSHRALTKTGAAFGQSMPEYLLIATIVSGIGLAGIVGFNGGIDGVFNRLKASLSQNGNGVLANNTNQNIAQSQLVSETMMAPSALPEISGGTAATITPAAPPAPPPAQQLQTLGTLLTSMDPANLPEVSGSNSTIDITQVILSANTLVQQANALEAAQKQDPGLNVSDLVFEARKVAAAQFFLAGVLLDGPGTLVNGKRIINGANIAQGMALIDLIIAQKPNDPEANNFKTFYQHDYLADWGVPAPPDDLAKKQKQQIDGYAWDYKLAYQPLKSTITQLNLQTQQANTVVTNGGNINNNANVNGNANQTLNDANAINACQNATCN